MSSVLHPTEIAWNADFSALHLLSCPPAERKEAVGDGEMLKLGKLTRLRVASARQEAETGGRNWGFEVWALGISAYRTRAQWTTEH